MKKNIFEKHIQNFDFELLFNELGWENFNNPIPIAINDEIFTLTGVAEKRGFVILQCPPLPNGKIPTSSVRKQIENKVTKIHFEHLIIYTDKAKNHQIWQIAIKEENKPKQVREASWYSHQDVENLFQRTKNLLFTLNEDDQITIVDVKQRISDNFVKNSVQVTKKFYTAFKKQHTTFINFINGIDDKIADKENQNKQWYASLMLNRLMFCYFIQKKGFLDQDIHYLQNKLKACQKIEGKSNFYSFYRSFLLELFHDGLAKPKDKRNTTIPIELGKVPYLNGGLFDVHELEQQFEQIQIKDEAFKNIFDFFDQWNWHLDSRVEATGKDINPDVIGYIFEKYINDRAAMGAYYTKEDITDYIGKNTIIPFLFDETHRNYKKGLEPNAEIWSFLQKSNDTYIYDAVKYGIPDSQNLFEDLPEDIQEGIAHPLEKQIVKADNKPHLWQIRKAWNQKTPTHIGLPTEIYRELIARRERYAEIKNKIQNAEITHINDFITYNLNIRQFTQDFIENTEDPEFIKHFYKALNKITILDPTCGSGAFLFAALNILEPLYEATITRMEQFVAENPNKHKFFEQVLAEIRTDKHPNLTYFIFKTIILNNLYGVDIMNEAVEIAKLRLFLKLVATVDPNPRKENFGLEPLPDIDFNIRAGNTLIGFATEDEILKTIQKKEPLFAADKLEVFKEEFDLMSKAFKHFQNSQLINDQGSTDFRNAKRELNKQLKNLNQKLNIYLAHNYGIDAETKPKAFNEFIQSHQPFHWFAQFYQIIAQEGGFDVVIGNPPYVGYTRRNKISKKSVSDVYKLMSYETLSTSNLYSFTIERSNTLMNPNSKIGMIVPNSAFANSSMESLQSFFKNQFSLN
ncbi:MAG: Eco57I restriction-modification methylase domain-containing protein, partial [Bernardetiaceae bacterium]|nr:Eco57I restriction-modification methylase domain-containing protein [Bernardetiaceae bacterium]